MQVGVPGKIRIEGLRRDLLHRIVLGQVGVQLEASLVVGEHQGAARRQAGHGQAHQPAVVALDIQGLVHLLGVGEGGRVHEDQVELPPGGLQPAQAVVAHHPVAAGVESVKGEVVPRPLQVGVGEIHADAVAGAGRPLGLTRPQRRLHGGGGGIAEEVEEALSGGHLAQHPAYRPVVQEQAGVEVVAQVDPQPRPPLLHLEALAAGRLLLVLGAAALALAALDHHPGRVDLEHLGNHREGIEEPLLGLGGIDGARRRVLLHVDPVAVDVDGQGILRYVGVIETVAALAALLEPLPQPPPVLLQPVGEHLGSLGARRGGSRPVAGAGIVVPAGRLRDRHQQQPGLERAVAQGVLLVGAQADAVTEVRVGGEDRQPPAREGGAHPLAELPVEADQLGQLAQPLAVGRVGDHQARRRIVQPLGARQLDEPGAMEGNQCRDAGAHGIGPGRRQRRRAAVEAVEPRAAALAADAGAGLSLALQLAPGRLVMARPAVEAEALAGQVGGHVGGHHGGLDQQGPGAAERVHQRGAVAGQRRPAGTHQQRGGQILLERGVAHVAPVAAAVQAVAGEVHAQDQPPAVQVRIEPQVGGLEVDVGPRPPLGLQAVDHAILDRLGPEAGVADRLGATVEIHRQARPGSQVGLPLDRRHRGPELFRRLDPLLAGEAEHYPVGQPRPEAGAVGPLEPGPEVHPAHRGLARLGPQGRQLVGQQQLDAPGTGGKKFKGLSGLAIGHEDVTGMLLGSWPP